MGKMKEKLRIRFDEDARREYLNGFRKRKKERKKSVVDKRTKEEREKKKEFRKQKKAEIEKRLEQYGFLDKDVTTKNPDIQPEKASDHKEYIHHPQQVVIVDLQPDLSGLLSTSINNVPTADCHGGHKKELKNRLEKSVKWRDKLAT